MPYLVRPSFLLRRPPEHWPVSRNLRQAREITLGYTSNLLATRRTDEPSWSNWIAWATSRGCRYLMMFTLDVIGPNTKGKCWISHVCVSNGKLCLSPLTPVWGLVWNFTLLPTRCRLHRGQWQSLHWPQNGRDGESGEFPAQLASNVQNVSIWWRHHGHRFTNGQDSQLVRLEPPPPPPPPPPPTPPPPPPHPPPPPPHPPPPPPTPPHPHPTPTPPPPPPPPPHPHHPHPHPHPPFLIFGVSMCEVRLYP